MTIVVVGRSSFLAQELQRSSPAGDWIFLSHTEAISDQGWTEKASCVVNFAFAPELKTAPYDAALDIDLQLSQMIRPFAARFIMLSSRQVYGASDAPCEWHEEITPQPVTPYGKAKLAIERALQRALPAERLTILRMANIFGYERHRPLFLGRALDSLAVQNKIVFDMSPDTVRDFYPVSRFTQALIAIATNPKPGIFNLGSGLATPCGDIAAWLIEGFGSGELVVTDNDLRDQFTLNTNLVNRAFSLPPTDRNAVRDACLSHGQRLRSELN